MKTITKSLYYIKTTNSLAMVIDIKDGVVHFSAATHLRDVFTTVSRYQCSIGEFISVCNPVKLMRSNFLKYTEIHDGFFDSIKIKDWTPRNNNSKPYLLSTDYKLQHSENETYILNQYENINNRFICTLSES